MRRKLGESLSSSKKLDRTVAWDVTTSSLEAWNAFARGRDLIGQGKQRQAIEPLLRATKLDRNFAAAYESLSVAYYAAGDLPAATNPSRRHST